MPSAKTKETTLSENTKLEINFSVYNYEEKAYDQTFICI